MATTVGYKIVKNQKPRIRPRKNQILVEPDPEESRESAHGIITPSNVEQERKAVGTVQAVGPDIRDVSKGDRVIYGAFAGEKLKLGDQEFVLLFDEDVLAFLED